VHQRQNPKNLQETPPNKGMSPKSIKGNTKNKADTKIKDKPPQSCTKTLKHHHKLPQKQLPPPTFHCLHITPKKQRQKPTQAPTSFEKQSVIKPQTTPLALRSTIIQKHTFQRTAKTDQWSHTSSLSSSDWISQLLSDGISLLTRTKGLTGRRMWNRLLAKTPITLYKKKIASQNYSHKTPYGRNDTDAQYSQTPPPKHTFVYIETLITTHVLLFPQLNATKRRQNQSRNNPNNWGVIHLRPNNP